MQDTDVHMTEAEEPSYLSRRASTALQLTYPRTDVGISQDRNDPEYDTPPRNWDEAVSPVTSRNYGLTRAQSLGVQPEIQNQDQNQNQNQVSMALIDPRMYPQNQQRIVSHPQMMSLRWQQPTEIDQTGYALGQPSFMPYSAYMRGTFSKAAQAEKLPNWANELVLSADPYAYRADIIGLSHEIPNMGYLGDMLRPDNWKNGDSIMDPAAAEAAFTDSRQQARNMANMIIRSGDSMDDGQPLKDQWNARLKLDQLIFRERLEIYNIFVRKGLVQRKPGTQLPLPSRAMMAGGRHVSEGALQAYQSQLLQHKQMQQAQQQRSNKVTPGVAATSQALRQITGTDVVPYANDPVEVDMSRTGIAQIMVDLHNRNVPPRADMQPLQSGPTSTPPTPRSATRPQHARKKSNPDNQSMSAGSDAPLSGGGHMSDIEMASEDASTPTKPRVLPSQKAAPPKKIHWYNDYLEALPFGEITQEATDAADAWGKAQAQKKANQSAAKVAAQVQKDAEKEKNKPPAKPKPKPKRKSRARVTRDDDEDAWNPEDPADDDRRMEVGPAMVAALRKAGITEVHPGDPSHAHIDKYVDLVEQSKGRGLLSKPGPSRIPKAENYNAVLIRAEELDKQEVLMNQSWKAIREHREKVALQEKQNQRLEAVAAAENARQNRAEARSLRRMPAVENMRGETVSVVVGEPAPNLPAAVPLPTKPDSPRKKSPAESELSELSDRDFEPPHPPPTTITAKVTKKGKSRSRR